MRLAIVAVTIATLFELPRPSDPATEAELKQRLSGLIGAQQ